MGRRSFHVVYLTALWVIAVAHAALTPYDYWKKMLPNTPMPAAISDLLMSDAGVGVEALAKGGVRSKDGFTFGTFSYDFVGGYRIIFDSNTQRRPEENVFFLEKDLLQGTKMKQDFTGKSPATAFVPRLVANTVPFSPEKFPVILSHFSVKPESIVAQAMKKTLQMCANKASQGGDIRYCATSLESMIHFATSALETHDIDAMSSVFITNKGERKQEYVIASRKEGPVGDNVACHPMPWPHAVFYCHVTPATKVYNVELLGKEDGAKVDAVAVCHMNTSSWNPKHQAFKMVKVKPGTAPICHFLPLGGILLARGL